MRNNQKTAYCDELQNMAHTKTNYFETFRKNGYRLTRQRQVVLDAVCMVGGHATVGEIYRQAKELDKRLDRSTLYRSLDAFIQMGLVISAETPDGERLYELAREKAHHHLVCKRCGYETEIAEGLIDDLFQTLEGEHDFTVEMDHLLVFGVCAQCSGDDTANNGCTSQVD